MLLSKGKLKSVLFALKNTFESESKNKRENYMTLKNKWGRLCRFTAASFNGSSHGLEIFKSIKINYRPFWLSCPLLENIRIMRAKLKQEIVALWVFLALWYSLELVKVFSDTKYDVKTCEYSQDRRAWFPSYHDIRTK